VQRDGDGLESCDERRRSSWWMDRLGELHHGRGERDGDCTGRESTRSVAGSIGEGIGDVPSDGRQLIKTVDVGRVSHSIVLR
jgi:hypothetical protein